MKCKVANFLKIIIHPIERQRANIGNGEKKKPVHGVGFQGNQFFHFEKNKFHLPMKCKDRNILKNIINLIERQRANIENGEKKKPVNGVGFKGNQFLHIKNKKFNLQMK